MESKIEKTKENYYDVLEQCGNGWHENENDSAPFIKYMLGIVLAAYRDFETRISLVDEKLPAIEMVRKAVYKKIGKFTKSEIMELVPSLSKASVENSLTQLMKDGVVDRHGKGKATFYTRADMEKNNESVFWDTWCDRLLLLEERKEAVIMRIINLGPWVFYIEGKPQFEEHKVGKWMYFFKDKERVAGFAKLQWSRGLF